MNKSKLLSLVLKDIEIESELPEIFNSTFEEVRTNYDNFNELLNITISSAKTNINKRITENISNVLKENNLVKDDVKLILKIISYLTNKQSLTVKALDDKHSNEFTLNSFESIKNNRDAMSEMLSSYIRFVKYDLRENVILIFKNEQ